MKVLLALALLVVTVYGLTEVEYQTAFTQWMQRYGKSYGHDEFRYRYRLFRANLDYINSYNARKKGTTLAINKFSDLSNAEFKSMYLGYNPSLARPASPNKSVRPPSMVRAPASFDWRTKGAVTDVKNQGQCGSCWAFSTTGSSEGCHQITTGDLVSLSEQNLVDCSTSQGNQGCDGGLMTQAMDYIISNGGIDTESSYPYTAQDGSCEYNSSDSGATLKSYYNVQAGSESDLLNTVLKGPTSVAIDASQPSFQSYSSGVYDEPNCSSQNLDHGVLAVGYSTDSGTDYWIVKNSWGTDWGMSGYIWMSRNANNQCGIATAATLPSC